MVSASASATGRIVIIGALCQKSASHQADRFQRSAPIGECRSDRRQYILLSVADNGTGMDKATRARAIEPFFSTKGIGRGTGLGLSIAHGLALQLGGALAVTSKVGAGTLIELWLPVSNVALLAIAAQPEEAAPLQRSGTALLVDDEDLGLAATADMLIDLGLR